MSRNPSSFAKRQRELSRQRKRQDKARKRAERRERKSETHGGAAPGEDPDIAGIVPGPQPLPYDVGPDDDAGIEAEPPMP